MGFLGSTAVQNVPLETKTMSWGRRRSNSTWELADLIGGGHNDKEGDGRVVLATKSYDEVELRDPRRDGAI